MLAPAGSTTIVCLPTGHGKTDVVLAAALLAPRGRGICLIVVPTVILAIDMERRVRRIFEQAGTQSPAGRYAYAGTLDDGTDARSSTMSGQAASGFSSPPRRP